MSVCVVQAPPTVKTPEKSHEDEEAMPPYDPDTQALIDGWFCCQSYSSICFRKICLYSSSCSLLFLCWPTVLWFTAAQKARDDFEEVEKSLREMDDQIRFVQCCDLPRNGQKKLSLKSSGSVANWFFICTWNSDWSVYACIRVRCLFNLWLHHLLPSMRLQCSLTLVHGDPAAEHCVEFSFDCVAVILKKSCLLISALMLSSLTCTASATNLPLASKWNQRFCFGLIILCCDLSLCSLCL